MAHKRDSYLSTGSLMNLFSFHGFCRLAFCLVRSPGRIRGQINKSPYCDFHQCNNLAMIYLKVLALHAIIVLGLRVIGVAIAQGCAPSAAQLPEPSDLPIISTLPDPFIFRLSDRRVRPRADWDCRRAELKTLVQHYLYGYWPDPTRETVRASRDGINLTISVSVDGKTASFPANITLPSGASRANRVPVVIATGPLVPVPPEPFLESGVAVAAFDVQYVANDSYARIGAFWDLYADRDIGVMTAWAWAESKILDALGEVVPEVDTSRVGVVGCSRYGKTALAAAIFDERFKLALVMSSGAEGIGPWRYYYESKGAAEKVENITTKYGYWSTTELCKFDNVAGNSTRIPFDAHELVSLVAPRAILWDEGEEDWWTNPEGSVSVVYGASKIVFDWLGIGDKVGVHVRPPPDDLHCGLSAYPAAQPFVQKVFFGTPTNVNFSNISPVPSRGVPMGILPSATIKCHLRRRDRITPKRIGCTLRRET